MQLSSSRPRWAIATPHTLASQQAQSAFADGGNAIDAAISAAAVLSVAYPNQCSIGGDLIALVARPDGSIHGLNGSGRAPRALTAGVLRDRHDQMPIAGPHVITVPGVIDGWHQLVSRWGRRPIERALRTAAELARDGVPVAAGLARDLRRKAEAVVADPGLREIFVRHGDLLSAGETLRQPRLADSLDLIAEGGPQMFYGGPIGAALVNRLRNLGSLISSDDFRGHQSCLEPPLGAEFAGERYLSTAGNTQGGFFLEALHAAEYARQERGAPLDPLGAGATLLARILAIAADDRDRYLGDAAAADYDRLLSDERARELLSLANDPELLRTTRVSAPPRAGGDTVAIVAADSEGNWISLIQSVFHTFGSTILEPTTGILLHNRGAAFSLRSGATGELIGGHRPPHTLMPVLVQDLASWRCIGAHGTMGGRAQPQIHIQIAHQWARGRTAAQAIEAPRWVLGAMESGAPESSVVKVERHVPASVQDAFARAGLVVRQLDAQDDGTGHAQLVRAIPSTDPTDTSRTCNLVAVSDPRADGAAFSG